MPIIRPTALSGAHALELAFFSLVLLFVVKTKGLLLEDSAGDSIGLEVVF